MKSELQFFITVKDEVNILKFINASWDKEEKGIMFTKFFFGENFIQFMPSKIFGNQLTAGRIAYATIDQKDDRAEKLYKEIRSYIKNISSNELVASSENKKYQKTIKSLYYSKNALIWLNNNKDHEFVQFKDGLVRFIPQ